MERNNKKAIYLLKEMNEICKFPQHELAIEKTQGMYSLVKRDTTNFSTRIFHDNNLKTYNQIVTFMEGYLACYNDFKTKEYGQQIKTT